MNLTYLTTQELADKIKYNARTIRTCLKDSVLFEGRYEPSLWPEESLVGAQSHAVDALSQGVLKEA